MQRLFAHGLATVLLVAGLGAAQTPTTSESTSRANPQGKTAKLARKNAAKPYQVGTASWYGSYFEGKPTASGEPYNMYDLTAAHPSLPSGSWVRVTNLKNRKAVMVRINDRGPIVPGRIIDLSYGAARVLDFHAKGLQRVQLDVVHPQTEASLQPFSGQ